MVDSAGSDQWAESGLPRAVVDPALHYEHVHNGKRRSKKFVRMVQRRWLHGLCLVMALVAASLLYAVFHPNYKLKPAPVPYAQRMIQQGYHPHAQAEEPAQEPVAATGQESAADAPEAKPAPADVMAENP